MVESLTIIVKNGAKRLLNGIWRSREWKAGGWRRAVKGWLSCRKIYIQSVCWQRWCWRSFGWRRSGGCSLGQRTAFLHWMTAGSVSNGSSGSASAASRKRRRFFALYGVICVRSIGRSLCWTSLVSRPLLPLTAQADGSLWPGGMAGLSR